MYKCWSQTRALTSRSAKYSAFEIVHPNQYFVTYLSEAAKPHYSLPSHAKIQVVYHTPQLILLISLTFLLHLTLGIPIFH